MKKYLIIFFLALTSMLLFSCQLFSNRINVLDEKATIVNDKYGDVEFVVEQVMVYKNLRDEFGEIEGLDYLLENKADRGSIHPEIKENYYVTIDIVKHNNEYKILVYDHIIKKTADKTKMFILTDYFLPIKIEQIESLIETYDNEQDIKNFEMNYIKKDLNKEKVITINCDILRAYYNKINEDDIYIMFYDETSKNFIIGNEQDVTFGNEKEEVIYYPNEINYQDFVSSYNTLSNEKIAFSLDKGLTYNDINNELEEFDIWGEAKNSEVSGMVFFYAFSYSDFLNEVAKAKDPNFYTYRYPTKETFDLLVEKYNEEYFEENILLFYYKIEGNISENYIYSVTKKDRTLTLNVNRIEGGLTAVSSWLEIITIKKSDIEVIEEVDVIVRTISPLTSTVYVSINNEHIRDFYLNCKTMEDFSELGNLKEINLFKWSLNVDLKINKQITKEELNGLINYLEESEYVISTGYKGKDFIRVQLEHSFYDEVVNKTLKINDFFKDQTKIDNYNLTIEILNFTPIGTITFVLEEKGKDKAKELIDELKDGDYPFINKDQIF